MHPAFAEHPGHPADCLKLYRNPHKLPGVEKKKFLGEELLRYR
jgi:hypothetical protein